MQPGPKSPRLNYDSKTHSIAVEREQEDDREVFVP